MIDRLLPGLVVLSTLTSAGAAAASGPTFSNPLHITNPYQPFTVGAVKVYNGQKDGKADVVDTYQGGVIVDHEGSWLVGGATKPTDPPSTANALAPTVYMPASPALGDVFKQEDLAPIVDETDTVKDVGLKVHVPAGSFPNCIQVLETTTLGDKPETKWYARGVGPIKSRTPGEKSELVASTLLPQ